MNKKVLNNIVDILLIFIANLSVIAIAIWVSAVPLTKSGSFYDSCFAKNDYAKDVLERKFPNTSAAEIFASVKDVTIDYFFGDAKSYQVVVEGENLFNEDEVRHMKDVKSLYIGGQIIAIFLFMAFVGCLFYFAKYFRRLRKKLLFGTIIFYGSLFILIGLFFLWGYISYMKAPLLEREYNGYFIYAFINFHYLLFPFDVDKVYLATGQNGYDIRTLTTILDTNLFMSAGIIIGVVLICFVLIWLTIVIVFYKKHPKICKKVDEIHERARNSTESQNQTQNS